MAALASRDRRRESPPSAAGLFISGPSICLFSRPSRIKWATKTLRRYRATGDDGVRSARSDAHGR